MHKDLNLNSNIEIHKSNIPQLTLCIIKYLNSNIEIHKF